MIKESKRRGKKRARSRDRKSSTHEFELAGHNID
jgi:hypothetical protein